MPESRELLEELLLTHSPGGWEDEIDEVIRSWLSQSGCGPEQDEYGNLYVVIDGKNGPPLTLVTAHKDELSLIVRRIDGDGRIWVEPIGSPLPAKYGEGPVDIITREDVIQAVLCMGSTHCSELSTRVHRIKTQPITWDMVYVDSRLDADELRQRGVRVGSRVVPARCRKSPVYLASNCVGGYALDDKAGVAGLLMLVLDLRRRRPAHDVCVAFSTSEEGSASGGSYLARRLTPRDFISVEVAPVAEEYPVELTDRPVVLLKDKYHHYNGHLTEELESSGERVGIQCQRAVVRSFGTDASVAARAGLVGRSACLCFPCMNTHGFELTDLGAIHNCTALLTELLTAPPRRE